MDQEENTVEFHGFADNDSLKLTIQQKLSHLNSAVERLQDIDNAQISREKEVNRFTTNNIRRPVNRFLKRGGSLPTPTKLTKRLRHLSAEPIRYNNTITTPALPVENEAEVEQNVIDTLPLPPKTNTNDSSATSEVVIIEIEMESVKKDIKKKETESKETDALQTPIVEEIPLELENETPLEMEMENETTSGEMKNETPLEIENGEINNETPVEIENETPSGEMKDETPLEEGEDEITLEEAAGVYSGNNKFLGTCIRLMTDVTKSVSSSGGIICCGVCGRVKRYRKFVEKFTRNTFMCVDCIGVVDKIFETALKGSPFACIRGPPICEGSCPLACSPPEQFCQACFAKTCLKNLPLQGDVYFKIWRSIPPMSRGCLPTSPAANPVSQNVGKVLYVKEIGDEVYTIGSENFESNSVHAANSIILVNGKDSRKMGDGDLNGTGISAANETGNDSTSNSQNSIPIPSVKNLNGSVLVNSSNSLMSKGAIQEEILLDRHIGQEGVKTFIDPILRPDLEDIKLFGFPVVVSGPAYPRKPLCFLCGSAGIEQLIFCSICCEPYHPYCAGDDLLMDTYVAQLNKDVDTDTSLESCVISHRNTDDISQLALKWTCRRCMSCKSCNVSMLDQEIIRCNRCQNPFHMKTCVDKQILTKVKDPDQLKKIWTCDTCLKCKSCGKTIESNRRLHTMKEAAAADSCHSDSDTDAEGSEIPSFSCYSRSGNYLMLCQECFKQRKKGSFCPICEAAYDDNDWDSKMMECCNCNRWIHSTCENLNDDQYQILGRLPEYIEYICRLCQSAISPGPALWQDAIQGQFFKECSSALLLFEKKAVGTCKRKRSSVDFDAKPHFVRSLFEPIEVGESEKEENESRRPRIGKGPEDSISGEDLRSCRVKMRCFIKYPVTLEENWYSLKFREVEILNSITPKFEEEKDRTPRTPIHTTPTRRSFSSTRTPQKRIVMIRDICRVQMNSIKSLNMFKGLMIKAIEDCCDTDEEVKSLKIYLKEAMQETFTWFVQSNESVEMKENDSESVTNKDQFRASNNPGQLLTTDPFKEVFWDLMDFYDDRACVLCGEIGDFPPDGCGRLLWCGINEWIHCNCAIWSSEVWEQDNGALQQIGPAIHRGRIHRCNLCEKRGATVSCCHSSCKNSFHFQCAIQAGCFLLEDKTMFCFRHKLTSKQERIIQQDMKLGRAVFVDLDWIHKRGLKASANKLKLFIGSLQINNLGNIVPISVKHMDWKDPSTTFLIPKNFKAKRIFWSLDNPWKKECYSFETGVASNGFPKKVSDVGVNLVVDHSKSSSSVDKALEGVNKFHQWVNNAPKLVDEELMEWLPACSEEFYTNDDDDFDYFTVMNRCTNSSPSSVSMSSFGSVKQPRTVHRVKKSVYNLRRNRNNKDKPGSVEDVSTEGYSSSFEGSSVDETPKSSRQTRAQKRRRSSTKSTKSPRKRRLFSQKKFDSPRRRSMRNLIREGNAVELIQKFQKEEKEEVDVESDVDSGVVEESSSTDAGSFDGEKLRCRVNLLTQFNETAEEIQNTPVEIIEEPYPPDSMSLSSVSVVLDNSSENLNMTNESDAKPGEDPPGKIYRAEIQVSIKHNEIIKFESCDAGLVWIHLVKEISKNRIAHGLRPLTRPVTSPNLSGGSTEYEYSDTFRSMGIIHRSVQYLIEQLPEVLCVSNRHTFQYSRKPYMDPDNLHCPLSPNSAGSARAAGFKGRKPYDMFGWLASKYRNINMSSNLAEDSSRPSQGLPVAMRFRDLTARVKQNFVVKHSDIHGRGLFSLCDVEKGEMLIEYAGEVIRPSLCDPREKYYESKGIGCYMFRIKTQVIDATLKGNAARFINHSCDPNCEAKTIRILGKDHIIIFALRKIFKGEELTYDYKFEREEDKIPCSCGAPKCRRYMN